MNHHLRFAGPALAAGVILILSSCSSPKVEPSASDPKHEITYEILIYDGPVDSVAGEGPAILSPEGFEILTKSFDQAPSFKGTTGGRLGETKTLSTKKEFVYPSAYSPAKFPKIARSSVGGGQGNFPVTPAQPKDFVTTEVGTTIAITGSEASNGIIELRVKLDRKVLLGFVNHGKPITTDATDWLGRKVEIIVTENRQEEPRFSEHLRDVTLSLQEGHCLLLSEHGVNPPEQGKPSFQQKRTPGYIALIRPIRR